MVSRVSMTALVGALALLATTGSHAKDAPSLEAVISYPFETGLVAAPHGDATAWVEVVGGVRTLWVAWAPDFAPHALTHDTADDGQELSDLVFSPDASTLVWVRGGDHDENWPADGGMQPDPANNVIQPQMEIWAAPADGHAPPVKLAEGDAPVLSAKGVLAFIKDHQVWTAPLDGKGKSERLFFDRGEDGQLAWSPDGGALAFVSDRGDHGFVGLYTAKDQPLRYLAPTTDRVTQPVWSPDSARIAFVSAPGEGGAPDPLLTEVPHPWAIKVANAATAKATTVWRSPDTPEGSYPEVAGGPNLTWMADDHLIFLAETDGWEHLYAVPAAGGAPSLLTPGSFMVEHVARSADGRAIIFDANTGGTPFDSERRHLFTTSADKRAPAEITKGDGLEYYPVGLAGGHVAFIAAGAKAPPHIEIASESHPARKLLATGAGADYPTDSLVVPKSVTFTAADGLTIHGDLFEAPGGGRKPAVIFVHGGPPRQMLLGWSYMDYYSNAYAMNQYLATHGFVVLSVNYRLGIGYGRAFQHPAHGGPRGAAEYQDVQAGARYLQGLTEVDPTRIGIWGGSYGGYLTAMALAHNSDVFKAGVDLHGVHDWTAELLKATGGRPKRYEQGDYDAFMKVAWDSSPVADLGHWTSPVLLIQGDDDRNVLFHQTVDLARRLAAQGAPYEEMVIPNEIHGFLRHDAWLKADTATAAFLIDKLGAGK